MLQYGDNKQRTIARTCRNALSPRVIKDKGEQAPRIIPMVKCNEVKELVMKRSGVIEKTSSPWSSPVDYRKLNDITKKGSYRLPRIDDTLAGRNWFDTLDLKSEYWEVEIADKDKK